MNPADFFTDGDWTLSQSRTTLSRRSDLEVLGTAELKHRKSTSPPICSKEMSQKKIEGIHDRFLNDSTYRDSQLKNLLD